MNEPQLERRNTVEHYIIGPAEEPDHSKWETELVYLTVES